MLLEAKNDSFPSVETTASSSIDNKQLISYIINDLLINDFCYVISYVNRWEIEKEIDDGSIAVYRSIVVDVDIVDVYSLSR